MTITIQVYGTDWCRSTFCVRGYLMNARLDYDFFDIYRDHRADDFVRAMGEGSRRYPVVVFPNETLTDPTVADLGRLLRDHEIELGEGPVNVEGLP